MREALKIRKLNEHSVQGVLGEGYKLGLCDVATKTHTKVVSDNLKLTTSINIPYLSLHYK